MYKNLKHFKFVYLYFSFDQVLLLCCTILPCYVMWFHRANFIVFVYGAFRSSFWQFYTTQWCSCIWQRKTLLALTSLGSEFCCCPPTLMLISWLWGYHISNGLQCSRTFTSG